jgi:hypothetical protein
MDQGFEPNEELKSAESKPNDAFQPANTYNRPEL